MKMMTKSKSSDYIIIGSGLAGLVFAYKLKKSGKSFVILESSSRSGGMIDTRSYKNSFYELGPNSFMSSSEIMLNLVKELGLEASLIKANFSKTKRYIYRQDLIEVPVSPLTLLGSPILTWASKFRLLQSFLLRPKVFREPDMSVYEYLSLKFNSEIAHLADVAIKGIWAGDSRKLSSRVVLKALIDSEQGSKGSSSKSKKKKMQTLSFDQGMQVLIEALLEEVGISNIVYEAKVEQLDFSETKVEIRLADHQKFESSSLALACPAYQSASYLQKFNPELASLLGDINYSPIYLFSFILDKSKIKNPEILEAFGYLVDQEDFITLGTIFSSQLFNSRKLDSEYLLTCFAKLDDIESVLSELIQVLGRYSVCGLEQDDFKLIDSKIIKQAIPQYHVGFSKSKIDEAMRKTPNLVLIGNYLKGLSLADTIDLSYNYSEP